MQPPAALPGANLLKKVAKQVFLKKILGQSIT